MKKIVQHLKKGAPRDVIILGDVMLDEYVFGSVHRISPEAPVPVVREERREWYLGGAANVAANCKHVGMNVHLISIINAYDQPGQRIRTLLKDIGISDEGIIAVSSRLTTRKKRIMAAHNQCLRVDTEHDKLLSEQERTEVINRFDMVLKPGAMILISDYAKGMIDEALMNYVITKARERGCLVLADPKGPVFNKYRSVNYLKPNYAGYRQLVDFCGLSPDASMLDNGRAIIQKLNLDALIVTMGEKGIRFISPTQDILSPAHNKHEVFDLSGAGDTVFAFLALALVHQLPIDDALKLANHAASVAISHLKTYAVSLDELIDKEVEPSEKIVNDWARLKIELDWQRAEGKRVVFTNGCFDILHSGHVHTLKEAKKRGDILVVALNSDDSVKRLNKGPERPINGLEERATVMAALGMVDFVTSFDQDTPQEILHYLAPDVLVKGGDYKAENIVGYDFLKSRGGEVYIVDFVPNKSTTRTIEAMKKQ